jgi:DNA/RNA endonuclease YhcR with UshA esterase domain
MKPGVNMKCKLLLLVCFAWCFVLSSLGQETKDIAASEASQHIGEHVAVCGNVASTRYLSTSRSKPTFLNLGKPYPNEDFTIVIWPEDRANFGRPELTYLGENICVTGDITAYRGKPEIIARNPSQIRIR